MRPLQRAAFFIGYLSDYINTLKYFDLFINSISDFYKPGGLDSGDLYDHLIYYLEGSVGEIDFYVDSSGKLNAVLSIYIHDSQRNDYPHHRKVTYDVMNTRKPLGDIPKSNFELIHKILNCDGIISNPHVSMEPQISACHDVFLSVMKREYAIKTSDNFECIVGHPVIVWPSLEGNPTEICYISDHFECIQQHFAYSYPGWLYDQDLFYQEPSCVDQFTCFKFKPDAITLATFNGNEYYKDLSFWANYHISDSTSQKWLYHAPQIRKTYATTHDNHPINYLGIVSGARVQIDIPIFLSHVIRYAESNKDTEVYLFISDPGIDPMHGKVIEPHIFWSLDKSGTKPLTEFSAALKGLLSANVTMTPIVYHWDNFYYEGLYELHKMCGITTSRYAGPSKFKHNSKQEQLRNSPLYIEDAGMNYLKTQHKLVKDREGHSWRGRNGFERLKYPHSWEEERYSPLIKPPNISSLSWIGVTALEDGFAVLGTVYETREQRRLLENYIYRARFLNGADEDDWEKITHVDVHSDGSDMDCFEELSEGSAASLDN
ncbi:hypothetical protein BDQ17DRAFT_1433240 [Cyathus striatus]|nr:hypothetical protein BDQ17DRAFT_1433240 [Cyathus striatus]